MSHVANEMHYGIIYKCSLYIMNTSRHTSTHIMVSETLNPLSDEPHIASEDENALSFHLNVQCFLEDSITMDFGMAVCG